jgi:hypothetical protein
MVMSLKKINKLPDINLLKLFFRYEDGKLIRNVIPESNLDLTGFTLRGLRRWNSNLADKEAGHEFTTTSGTKSKQVRMNHKMYYVHRIIYKLCTGEEPIIIDHENGNPLDNRIENLRSVTNTENSRNSKKSVKNTSGVTGVSYSKIDNSWEAYIWDKYIKVNLGRYGSFQVAVDKSKEAEVLYGYHTNHGREEHK